MKSKGRKMRSIYLAIFLTGFLVHTAQGAEIRVLSPGFVYDSALVDLAAAFTKETGTKVTVTDDGMARIVNDIKTGTPPADVIVLPLDLMDTLALNGGIQAGSYALIGRVEIGLAVKAGVPHPDISTVAKLIAVLKSAREVMYNDPKGGSMEAGIIDAILKRQDFAGVHSASPARGEGGEALSRGQGDMALQLIPEILNQKNIELVGPLPAQLGTHMDGAAAVSARATDTKDALAFIRYIRRPEATAAWKAKGLNRFE
jgi:molybdate transport system substrate-binding protein